MNHEKPTIYLRDFKVLEKKFNAALLAKIKDQRKIINLEIENKALLKKLFEMGAKLANED